MFQTEITGSFSRKPRSFRHKTPPYSYFLVVRVSIYKHHFNVNKMNPILLKPRLKCTHGALTLSLRPDCGGVPGVEFKVLVTSFPKDRPFERGLVIRPGTVLKLCHGKKASCFVTVRVFNPFIQYGRFCASGRLTVSSSSQ